jgi:hypothetical protein
MSAKVMGLVWDLPFPPHQKFILLACADNPGATPALLGTLTGLRPLVIQQALRSLDTLGVLHDVGAGGALVIDEPALEARLGARP